MHADRKELRENQVHLAEEGQKLDGSGNIDKKITFKLKEEK